MVRGQLQRVRGGQAAAQRGRRSEAAQVPAHDGSRVKKSARLLFWDFRVSLFVGRVSLSQRAGARARGTQTLPVADSPETVIDRIHSIKFIKK